MTNLGALKAEVEPYSFSSDDGYIKRLIDAGLDAEATYTATDKLTVAKCAIASLVSFLSLSNETLGPTGQSFDRKGLEERLKAICDENGLRIGDYLELPRVKVYRNLF